MDFIRMFNLIDTDQSGEITRSELIKFMQENNFTESFVDKWLTLFDFNQRGRITMDDFCERLGLVIDEDMHKHLKNHRPSYLNLDDLDDFVDIDEKMKQQIIHVSTNKPISTPIKRNYYFQENFFEEIPEMKEVESKDNFDRGVSNHIIEEVITKTTAFPVFGMSQSNTNPVREGTKNEQVSHDISEVQSNSLNFRKALSLPKSTGNNNENHFNIPIDQADGQTDQDKKHKKRSNTMKSSSPKTKPLEKSTKLVDFFNFNKLKTKSSENKPKSATQKNTNDNPITPKITSLDRKRDHVNKPSDENYEQSTSTNFQNTRYTWKTELENEHKKNHSFMKGLSQHKRTHEKGESMANNSYITEVTDHKGENQKKEKSKNPFLKLFQKDKKPNTKEDDKHDKMSMEKEKNKKNAENYKRSSKTHFDEKQEPKEKNSQENRRSLLVNEHGIETASVFKHEKLESKLHELMKLDDVDINIYISNEEKLRMKNRQEFEKEMDKMILHGKNVSNKEFSKDYMKRNESKDFLHDSSDKDSEKLIKTSPLELNISNNASESRKDKTDFLTSLNPLSRIDKDNKSFFHFESGARIDRNNSSETNQLIDHNKVGHQHNNSKDVNEKIIGYRLNHPLKNQLLEIVDQVINEPSGVDKSLPEEIIIKYEDRHNHDKSPNNKDLNIKIPEEHNLTGLIGMGKVLQLDHPDRQANQAKLNRNSDNSLNQNAVQIDKENMLAISKSIILQFNNQNKVYTEVNNKEYARNNESKDLVHDSVDKDSERLIKSSPLDLNISNEVSGSREDKNDILTSSNLLNRVDKDNKSFNFESPERIDMDNSSKTNQFIDHNKIDLQQNNSEDVIEEIIRYEVNHPLENQLPQIVNQDVTETSGADNYIPEDIILNYKDRPNHYGNDLDITFSAEHNLNDKTGTPNQIRKDIQTELDERENRNKLNANPGNALNWNALKNDQENKIDLNEFESFNLEKSFINNENKGLIEDVTKNISFESIKIKEPFSSIEEYKTGPFDSNAKDNLINQIIENELNNNFKNKDSLQINESKLNQDPEIIPKDNVHARKEDLDLADQGRDSLEKSSIQNTFKLETEAKNQINKIPNKSKGKTDLKSDENGSNYDQKVTKTLKNENRILQENTKLNKFPTVKVNQNSAEKFDKILIENDSVLPGNESEIGNCSDDDLIPPIGQSENIKKENKILDYSKIQKMKPPHRKVKIIHKDFGKNTYQNLVDDIVNIYEETKTRDDWNGHELMKRYLDKYYERIWSVIIVNNAYELYVTYENMVIFQYNSLTFIIWKTIESP